MKRALGIQALTQFAVNRSDVQEEITWSLFDFTTYLAAGQTTLSFFQNPIGQAGKTFIDTNMDLAGQIPKGQTFLVEGLCVEFFPSGAINTAAAATYSDDIKAVAESGLLTLTVGSKKYVNQGPLGLFPQSYRQQGFAAAATTTAATDHVTDYSQNIGKEYSIIPVLLTSNQNFLVTLTWPAVVALPSTADGRIGVRLAGRLFRNAQ